MAKLIPLALYELLLMNLISSLFSFDYLDISDSKSKRWVFVSCVYVFDMCIIIIIFVIK